MASHIQKIDDHHVVRLPPELSAQLGWDVGDMVSAEVVDGGIKLTRTNTMHDRAMEIARKGMAKYRKAFEILAKS